MKFYGPLRQPLQPESDRLRPRGKSAVCTELSPFAWHRGNELASFEFSDGWSCADLSPRPPKQAAQSPFRLHPSGRVLLCEGF